VQWNAALGRNVPAPLLPARALLPPTVDLAQRGLAVPVKRRRGTEWRSRSLSIGVRRRIRWGIRGGPLVAYRAGMNTNGAKWLGPVMALALVAGGCGEPENVVGSADDARVASGSYAGYSVVRPCSEDGQSVGVQGAGKKVPVGGARDAWIKKVKGEAMAYAGVHGVGTGRGACGLGVVIHTDDWRTVDAIVANVGRLYREDDISWLGPSVTVTVDERPRALAP
jgi:hypothetical protein